MVDSQGGEGAGNGSLDMSRNTCSMKDVKIRQNCQIHRADFALTNLTKIHQNHHIYEHSDG